jgi:hypothetical protein
MGVEQTTAAETEALRELAAFPLVEALFGRSSPAADEVGRLSDGQQVSRLKSWGAPRPMSYQIDVSGQHGMRLHGTAWWLRRLGTCPRT